MKSIWRYEVPADDKWYEVPLTGDPVAAAMTLGGVEFWAEHIDGPGLMRRFRVFNTGQPIPEDAAWRATCARGFGGIVWHLYEAVA